MLHLLPLESLLEYGLTADSCELNQLAIKVIGIFYSGNSITQFHEIFPDTVSYIKENFIKPFVQVMKKS